MNNVVQGHFSKGWLSRYYALLNLIRLHKPKSIVEVGTYDGERACGMLEEALRHHPDGGITYTGYDLFETATAEDDSREFNVRAHPSEADVARRLHVFCARYDGRVQFRLVKGNTRDTLQPQNADFAFIDGGHSVETIQSDYAALNSSQIIVLDDYYEPDRGRQGPDTKKVGCNALIPQLTDFYVLPTFNEVSGCGRVKMVVKFGADRLRGVRLRPDGPIMPYLFHKHNCGLPTDLRRTERTVELALARQWVEGLMQDKDAKPVEIGAVTPYYWQGPGFTMPVVIDPADNKATRKESLFRVPLNGLDVLSISTIEHVGGDQYGISDKATPLDAFQHIAASANRFLITFPHGWENAASLQRMLFEQREMLDNDKINLYTLTRQPDETWAVSDDLKPYGNRRTPWANTLIVLERGGLL